MSNPYEMPMQKQESSGDQASIEAVLKLTEIFNSYASGKERIDEIIRIIKPSIKRVENGDEIIKGLRDCDSIEDSAQFVAKTLLILKPIIDLKNDKVGEGSRDREFIKINEILSYGLGDGHIHIHVVPDEKVENFLSEFSNGMKKLAEITAENGEVREIVATSWIIAAHPQLLERFGFTIDGEIDEETREAHFAGEGRPIWKASMKREKLLDKYLSK